LQNSFAASRDETGAEFLPQGEAFGADASGGSLPGKM